MDKKDIYSLFGLGPEDDDSGEETVNLSEAKHFGEEPEEDDDVYPYAILNLSEFEIDEAQDCIKSGQKDLITPDCAGDFYATVFRRKFIIVDECKDQLRRDYLSALVDTPDYAGLHDMAALNVVVSKMAAESLIRDYHKFLLELKGGLVKVLAPASGKKKKKEDAEGEKLEKETEIIAAAAKGAKGAKKEATETMDAMDALGMGGNEGMGEGCKVGAVDMKKLGRMFERFKKSKALKKISEYAGRFIRYAEAAQKSKVSHGYDDVVGVTMTGDLAKLTGSELCMLANPLTRMEVMSRLVDNRCLGKEYRGVDKVAKGPVVFIVDSSSSMECDDNFYKAKGLALAMARVAKIQNRWCCLVEYSGAVDEYSHAKYRLPNGSGWRHVMLKPGEDNQDELMDWLENYFGWGSYRDVPVVELPQKWASLGCPKGITDAVFVTDDHCRITESEASIFNKWKELENVKAYALLLAGAHNRSGLNKVCDQLWNVGKLSVEDTVIKDILSI